MYGSAFLPEKGKKSIINYKVKVKILRLSQNIENPNFKFLFYNP